MCPLATDIEAMAQFFEIHPDNPQARLIRQAADILRRGGLVALPTDSCYTLVCHLDDKGAVERLRRIRQLDDRQHLALLCRDLTHLANYAKVGNAQYRLMKSVLPGPYTFILEASREVPRRVSHASKKTIGIRVPDHSVVQALLTEMNEPLIATSLQLPGADSPLTDPHEVRDALEHQVDLVMSTGEDCGIHPTTVIDWTGEDPVVLREGAGALTGALQPLDVQPSERI
jgi:tRNA threonylcarbamoyl adenosine modification protein (Sua5/YciO/YrdC/YwlC family)